MFVTSYHTLLPSPRISFSSLTYQLSVQIFSHIRCMYLQLAHHVDLAVVGSGLCKC